MKINLEGNRKLVAGIYTITLSTVTAVLKPELFTNTTSYGWTVITIVGLIAGANVFEWKFKEDAAARANGNVS